MYRFTAFCCVLNSCYRFLCFQPLFTRICGSLLSDRMAVTANGTDDINAYVQIQPHKCSTTLFTLSDKNDNSDVIAKCVRILQRGGVIAFPTDTLYGVACLAQSTEALEKLYTLKERNTLKPVAICVGQSYDVCQWARFPPALLSSLSEKLDLKETPIYQRSNSANIMQDFLNDFLPGPVTIITSRSPALNINLNPSTSSVGIRVPDHTFVQELANSLREPLALTSANISGQESALSIEDFRHMWPRLDAVVDGGIIGSNYDDTKVKYTKEGSTVFEIMEDGQSFKVLRTGCAYQDTVRKLQKNWNLKLVL